MHLRFEPNLEHQKTAVNAVIGVFEGAPYTRPEERLWVGDVSANVLRIDKERVRENVKRLAEERGIAEYAPADEPDFSIEMETGTGKTYVYIRAIFQLHKQYGLHKFLIVVPSVAVREGVLATLRDTRRHFLEIYGEAATVIEYNSKRLHDARSFCVDNHLSIMVMNKQSFDSDRKLINDENRDSGNLLRQMQKTRPVVVMDEPQEGMDTPNMRQRLAAFNPLFKLRFSATHRQPKNVIHRLTPCDAYNSGLVKKIAVMSIHEESMQSNVTIKFHEVILRARKDPTARLGLNVRLKGGEIKEKILTIKALDNLEVRTGNPVYSGWSVENIGTTDLYNGVGYIKFHGGEELKAGETIGVDREDIFRQQIHRAIKNHFGRKRQLVPMGIKPLALFFIDRVANYVDEEGVIRRLFTEEYAAIYKNSHGKPPTGMDAVHGGYFAQTGKGEYTDNPRSMEGEGNKAIYDRILKDKTRLLSFDDPMEFIFSHSALGVGWDNPNVFTICTLNQSVSKIKKRQEIGRGLRLCVRQNGERYRDPENTPEGKEVNLLTVVPNESYHNFVATYQMELQEEAGEHVRRPAIRDDRREPAKIKRNEERFRSDDFAQLWRRIANETRCKTYFHEESLIAKGVERLSKITVTEGKLRASLHRWDALGEEEVTDTHLGGADTAIAGRHASLNIIRELSEKTSLASATVAAILAGLPRRRRMMLALNPMKFMAEAIKPLRRLLLSEMVRLVRYEKTGRKLSMRELFEMEGESKGAVTPTPRKGLYDHIIHESEYEQDLAARFDRHSTVRLFFKLPANYKIPTPIGDYTPDFALVMEKLDLDDPTNQARFYFVIEVKGTDDLESLAPDERMKIQCAIKHFTALGLKGYLAPVDRTDTFDAKAARAVGETFF